MNSQQEHLLHLLNGKRADESWSPDTWTAILSEARRHKLEPYLLHCLYQSPHHALPAHVSAPLQQAKRRNMAANMLRFRGLEALIRAFNEQDIPIMLLKGVHLALAVYTSPGLRPMLDMDILIDGRQMQQANRIMTSLGYIRDEHHAHPLEDGNQFHYIERATGNVLEIHWALIPPEYPFRINNQALWLASQPFPLGRSIARVLCPEDLLIHLSLHAAIHRLNMGLRALCDIREVLVHLHVDWNRLRERANNMALGRAVRLPLSLAAALLDAPVPEEALSWIRSEEMPVELWQEACETVLLNSLHRSDTDKTNPNLLLFIGRRNWTDKRNILLRRFFPSRQLLSSLYPVSPSSWRIYLYYPWHSLILIRRNLPGLKHILHPRRKGASSARRAAQLMDWMLKEQ